MAKKKTSRRRPEQQQPIWTRADLFFGNEFSGVLGAVHLPTTAEKSADAPVPARRHSERAQGADYTVAQAAEAMNLSQDKVRALFRNEPGVKKLTDPDAGKKRKRKYETLRIPQDVFDRVNRRLSVPSKGLN